MVLTNKRLVHKLNCGLASRHKSTQVFVLYLTCVSLGHWLALTLVEPKIRTQSTQVFYRLATQHKSTQVDRQSTVHSLREIYDLRELANPFGHPSQVRTQFSLALQTCVDLHRLASPFGQRVMPALLNQTFCFCITSEARLELVQWLCTQWPLKTEKHVYLHTYSLVKVKLNPRLVLCLSTLIKEKPRDDRNCRNSLNRCVETAVKLILTASPDKLLIPYFFLIGGLKRQLRKVSKTSIRGVPLFSLKLHLFPEAVVESN